MWYDLRSSCKPEQYVPCSCPAHESCENVIAGSRDGLAQVVPVGPQGTSPLNSAEKPPDILGRVSRNWSPEAVGQPIFSRLPPGPRKKGEAHSDLKESRSNQGYSVVQKNLVKALKESASKVDDLQQGKPPGGDGLGDASENSTLPSRASKPPYGINAKGKRQTPDALIPNSKPDDTEEDSYYWGKVQEQISSDVHCVFYTYKAFAALKFNGSVVTWGSKRYGGDSSKVKGQIARGVQSVYNTRGAFAALKIDGSVVAWGSEQFGGDSSAVKKHLEAGVVSICSASSSNCKYGAFAALKSDRSVIVWGDIHEKANAVKKACEAFGGRSQNEIIDGTKDYLKGSSCVGDKEAESLPANSGTQPNNFGVIPNEREHSPPWIVRSSCPETIEFETDQIREMIKEFTIQVVQGQQCQILDPGYATTPTVFDSAVYSLDRCLKIFRLKAASRNEVQVEINSISDIVRDPNLTTGYGRAPELIDTWGVSDFAVRFICVKHGSAPREIALLLRDDFECERFFSYMQILRSLQLSAGIATMISTPES